jgi:DNA-binding PadR family transcriptional regulator
VLSILSGADVAEFTYLRERLQTTDGNLSVHLSKLEKAGYVSVQKQFVKRTPVTHYRITERGRKALLHYVQDLKSLLGANFEPSKGLGSGWKKKERK